ncbi:MAG TPA: TerC family protein [Acidimicrobiia bacterium]|nr:TerC family protein [Acidimicrobiia bacterium]
MDTPLWAWGATLGVIFLALALDLFVFHRKAHEVSLREAAWASLGWVTLGITFGVVVWVWGGTGAGEEYFAGYLIEKALSVENIFVFALVLGYFAVPPANQHRVLFFGVLGALILRGAFIAGGKALLDNFHWMIYVFGGFLVLTAIRLATQDEISVDPGRNPVLRAVRRLVPMTDRYEGQRFWVRRAGKLMATPMLAVLVAVETTDVIFAVDSIPAIFAVTTNTFIVFTSNAFALLGLRALYFLLAGAMHRLAYLKVGLAAVLALVGVKMLITDFYKVPIAISLGAIAAILATAVAASLWKARSLEAADDGRPAPAEAAPADESPD